jgi:opacity protein-like surface antigen
MKAKNILVIAAAALFSAVAAAGYLQPAPVMVTLQADGSGAAHGDMATARFSDNDVELIGCGVRAFDDGVGGSFNWGFCQAVDETEVRGFCSTMRSDLLDLMKSTADYSFVTFAWNADGECTQIGFSTQSFYIPEHGGKEKKGKK